jgi:hypothetical protein
MNISLVHLHLAQYVHGNDDEEGSRRRIRTLLHLQREKPMLTRMVYLAS